MLTSVVIEHFGNKSRVASALGIGKAAVSKWGERVPPFQASRLHELTAGDLDYNPNDYIDWYRRRPLTEAA